MFDKRRTVAGVALASGLAWAGFADAQMSSLFAKAWFEAIRAEASGELPLVDFRQIVTRFSGFSPSKGGDQMAEYIAGRLRENGLESVTIEGFPADGSTFFWAFLTEPAWEGESATLTMVKPRVERLSDFAVHRVVLGRYSTSADVTSELVDVGSGMRPEDYEGKDVKGRIVLVSGEPQTAHAEAVWRRGAAGIVAMRTVDPEEPTLVSGPGLGNRTGVRGEVAWRGPSGEPPGFMIGISMRQGQELRALMQRQPVVVHATVKATTGSGEYKQVEGVIPGTDPSLKEIWIKSHTNYRNTGGGNNLTGVGATLEIARVLQKLIREGKLPRPRRTIRFMYSAEHFGSTYQFYKHPERLSRPLTFFSVDMTGFNQEKVDGAFRMYRTPHSKPHFLSDVGEEFVHAVGRANASSGRPSDGFDPTFAPTGSQDPFRYYVDEFWAPSDHEEMVEGSIGIPSLEFGHPDRYIGTQADDLDKVDATQMRRSVLLIASAAYYLASMTSTEVPQLTTVMSGYAQARIGRDATRAFTIVNGATRTDLPVAYREALNVLRQSITRERATLQSLSEIGLTVEAEKVVQRVVKQLESVAAANDAALRDRAAVVAGSQVAEPRPSAAEQQLDQWVPVRSDAIRGPVNLWRPEYGSVWVAQKTGNSDVLGQVPLTKRGRFMAYEALNFADGRRTLLDIRDAISAEYVPVEATEVEQYFRFLERLGVVSIAPARRSER